MAEKEIIEKNLREYLEIADYSFSRRKFNSAVVLYYKALAEICDLALLTKLNKIGANHAERFELLRTASPQLYQIASKLFRFYRDAYNKEISETIAKIVKENIENAKKIIFA